MPKQKITKDMVINAAFELAREGGMEQVLVKSIAEKLGCSVQPIYSYCSSMENLRHEVLQKAAATVQAYVFAHTDVNDMFRSVGYAYVQLAAEEPELFRLFALQTKRHVASVDDLLYTGGNPHIDEMIAETLHVTAAQAKALHLNMLVYTIGICTIIATAEPGIPASEITEQLEQAYQAFLQQAMK
ncbi:MAG: TetR/AcrR family transcriptional regulator [Eubacteriales bacterium]|nr:TetR/AcrR family transcriptional regulator [Eubacteriales bacterium]